MRHVHIYMTNVQCSQDRKKFVSNFCQCENRRKYKRNELPKTLQAHYTEAAKEFIQNAEPYTKKKPT